MPLCIFKTFFKFSILSLIKTNSSAYKISFINPFLAFSEITFTAIAKSNDYNTDLDLHQLVARILRITQIPLKLLFLPCDKGSSPLLQLLLVNLFFSLPTLSNGFSISTKHTYDFFLLIPIFLLHSSHYKQCI